ncbi:secreted RxLR effector protein 161-like [Malus sylvestris]|uniref:secreted RxLR effector protein 161-like n=1 Tax=Malus sylvestris TaxID=3752 RepID=UPI0021AC168F|nr:secreted RxLR effector protein 161-like [Malus sylvestris]
MKRPTEMHLQAAKRVLRYVNGTISFEVFYKKRGNQELLGYTDSDYAGDQDDKKSTSRYVFLMSSSVVSWSSKKQPVVTLSTTEAEFISAESSACQPSNLLKNLVLHGRNKHIDVHFHFLRDLTNEEIVELVQCSTQE